MLRLNAKRKRKSRARAKLKELILGSLYGICIKVSIKKKNCVICSHILLRLSRAVHSYGFLSAF
jgi:hypothetical protein